MTPLTSPSLAAPLTHRRFGWLRLPWHSERSDSRLLDLNQLSDQALDDLGVHRRDIAEALDRELRRFPRDEFRSRR
jgi:uncharacterized protein YjiS (DUF1127 family)